MINLKSLSIKFPETPRASTSNLDRTNAFAKFDKPLTKKLDGTTEITNKELNEKNTLLNFLDKPLNENIEGFKNNMWEELSKKIREYLTPEKIDELRKKYPNLDKELTKLETAYREAKTPAERLAVMNQLEKAKGRIFEVILKEVLKEKFDFADKKQISVVTKEGTTKPDIMLHGAKKDIVIGDTTIKKGESLGGEVKCGSAGYINSQKSHICKQILGHGEHSVVIVTKDFYNMSETAKEEFLKSIKERNSSVCVLDISSQEVGTALFKYITREK